MASAARSVTVQQLSLSRPEASEHDASGTVVCSLRVSLVVGVDLTADEARPLVSWRRKSWVAFACLLEGLRPVVHSVDHTRMEARGRKEV